MSTGLDTVIDELYGDAEEEMAGPNETPLGSSLREGGKVAAGIRDSDSSDPDSETDESSEDEGASREEQSGAGTAKDREGTVVMDEVAFFGDTCFVCVIWRNTVWDRFAREFAFHSFKLNE